MGKHTWCVCATVEEIVVLSLEICIAEKRQKHREIQCYTLYHRMS